MAIRARNLSTEELKNIVKESFLAEPLISLEGIDIETSPGRAMSGRSTLLDNVRQLLPQKVNNTAWFSRIQAGLPDGDLKKTPGIRRRIANAIGGIPLGGYDSAIIEELTELRDSSSVRKASTIDARKVPLISGQEIPIGDSIKARAAQTTGVIASDVARDGLRNIWWYLNAPQAVSQIASLQAMHSAGVPYMEKARLGKNPLIGRGSLRLAATAPAVIATSAAIGNIGRPAGYKAILPSEDDPRKTDSPVGELLSRYFLGRTGRLLPFDEFTKERPDVSKGDYERYKRYLFDKKVDLNPLDGDVNVLGALRGTTEGIHGPEVNFMGKSIPLLTGIIPSAAAVAGVRRGIRRAGRRLTEDGGLDQLAQFNQQLKDARKRPKKDVDKSRIIDELELEIKKQRDENSLAATGQALLYGGGYAGAAGLIGNALESIRRDMGQED